MHRYISKVIRYLKMENTTNKTNSINQDKDILLSDLVKKLDTIRNHLDSSNDILMRYIDIYTMISQNKNTSELSSDIGRNLDTLSNVLGSSKDLIMRKFNFGCNKQTSGALVYISGLVNVNIINNNIMKPLMYDTCLISNKENSDMSSIDIIQENLLSVSNVQKITSLDDLLRSLLSGSTILLVSGSKEALRIDVQKWECRNIETPETENVVRGPREGFTETLSINTTLLRRKIRHPDLRFETFTIGEKTGTDVCIAYIRGIANPKLILEIKKRLNSVQTDAILESGYIEAFIEDAPYSIFPTVGNSEKPDNVAAKILEGRAAIFVDGTPFVLTAPLLFIENFQSSEDYYSRPFFASTIRIIRFAAYFITILAPAVYVALTTFHQELIPTLLLFTMTAGHEGVPFPAVVEAAIMIITFEILREAGVRLPRPVGSAISIVGALVIGESAVSAGLITPFMIIVVAFTAICSFIVPAQTDSASILRYFLLILSGFMGGFGIFMGMLVILIHLASLRSFGIPYFSPIAPYISKDIKDSFIRQPLRKMITRPKLINQHNSKRQQVNLPSAPTEKK